MANMSYKESYNLTGALQLENLRIKFEKAKSECIQPRIRKNRFVDSFTNPSFVEDLIDKNQTTNFDDMF